MHWFCMSLLKCSSVFQSSKSSPQVEGYCAALAAIAAAVVDVGDVVQKVERLVLSAAVGRQCAERYGAVRGAAA